MKTNVTPASTTDACASEVVPVAADEPQLSVKQWGLTLAIMAGLFVAIPRVWPLVEDFQPGRDYRMPYAISDDYWLYQRYCQGAVDQHDVMVVGDSVIWGHYVPPDGSLSHYLNQRTEAKTFVNLGIDGIHPAALAGLLQYHGRAIRDKTVILGLNPLWMTSKKHDLQTEKEFRFNHPGLVPQFTPRIACYTESLPNRLHIVLERRSELLSWAAHLRTAYFNKMDLTNWAMAHPYETLSLQLPQPKETIEQAQPWLARGRAAQNFPWVSLDTSVQWTFFKRAIQTLRTRGNTVFVLMGPFNEHMMTDQSLATYGSIKAGVETWLQDNNVAYAMPSPLPSELYADASHPLEGGYDMLAQWLVEDEAFKSVILSAAEPAQ
ncbi:MAG: hypothetical protein GY809_23000 [Planctomycetes bacterium]|nr:hypothetical protein [Planctomycetota bacterium]